MFFQERDVYVSGVDIPFSYRELLDLAPGHVIQQVQVDLVLGLVREAESLRSREHVSDFPCQSD